MAVTDVRAEVIAPTGLRLVVSRRWLQVFAAAMFINTSYGTQSYAFSVLITKSGPGGEFGAGFVSLCFGLALLVSGVAGLFAGTVADLFGTRRLMAIGAIVGAGGLALAGASQERWEFLVIMAIVVGPAMAATFYEPIYVLMNRWFAAADRPRAYGVLTLLSGFSITIYTPLTRWFVDTLGWREAMAALGAILLVVGLLVPALIHEPIGSTEPRARQSPRTFLAESREGLRQTTPAFWWFTIAFFVATLAFSGFSFHMISQLETRGFDKESVATAIAVTGVASLPARLLLPILSGRAPGAALLGVCFALLGVAALIASSAGAWWQVWLYVGVFGAVFGAVYPLRALVTAERFAGPYFGRVIGVQALFVASARAAGPIIIGLMGTSQAAYQFSFRVAAIVLFLAGAATWLSLRKR